MNTGNRSADCIATLRDQGCTRYAVEELVVRPRRYDAIKFDVHGVDRTSGIANLQARIAVRALPRKEDR